MFCSNCGKEVSNEVKFCTYCGSPLSDQSSLVRNDGKQERGEDKSIAPFVLGIVGLIAWFLPIAGIPIAIVGLVLGLRSRKKSASRLAMAGIVLCIISLVASIVNASIGAYMGFTGQLFS